MEFSYELETCTVFFSQQVVVKPFKSFVLPHQMRTIQLFNHKSVPCWWSIAEEVNHVQKVH